MTRKLHDVLIIGAGPAGLSLAAALQGSGLSVLLVERQPEAALVEPRFDGREIALTQLSVRHMQDLGQWARIDPAERSPLKRAKVLNGPSSLALWVDPDNAHDELGFLVPNHLIRKAAFGTAFEAAIGRPADNVSLRACVAVRRIARESDQVAVELESGEVLHTRLAVAADSRFSETRRAMGIAADMHDFGRSMMVCRMALEVDHEHVAWEWFGHGQTLALLPLNGPVASAVITLPHRDIESLMQLDDAGFNREMTQRFDGRLGAMHQVGTRHAYPLVGVYARRFVGPRFACVGDAAVGMHPVTAHGFNFGLAGAISLAAGIREAAARGEDFAAPGVLERWERHHRAFTRPLYLATNALATLYADERAPARLLRTAALTASRLLPPVRRAMSAAVTGGSAAPHPLSRMAAGAFSRMR
ncbi:MAG: 5-demethoxyubiquinol-8 5-hydroxylase UbiM [Betaproteobacteria bacterium]|nr:5-demethoxyubiquinol-8 5-hydroxylase UbiM [Betaproteobacteria bacterium]